MSRVGKHPVHIPSGVTVTVKDGVATAKGKKGELSMPLTDDVKVAVEGANITVVPANDNPQAKRMWATTQRNLTNLVTGVSEGFEKKLELVGVGYRANMQGKDLVLTLGFSHEVRFPVPTGITIAVDKQTAITITGANKQQVGQVAAEIRSFREPEPYKGKGVKYEGERILRKEGKKK